MFWRRRFWGLSSHPRNPSSPVHREAFNPPRGELRRRKDGPVDGGSPARSCSRSSCSRSHGDGMPRNPRSSTNPDSELGTGETDHDEGWIPVQSRRNRKREGFKRSRSRSRSRVRKVPCSGDARPLELSSSNCVVGNQVSIVNRSTGLRVPAANDNLTCDAENLQSIASRSIRFGLPDSDGINVDCNLLHGSPVHSHAQAPAAYAPSKVTDPKDAPKNPVNARSWSTVVTGDYKDVSSCKLQYIAPQAADGHSIAFISNDDLKIAEDNWANSIVFYVIGKHPYLGHLQACLKRI